MKNTRKGQPRASRKRLGQRRLTRGVVRPAEDGVEDGPSLARGRALGVATVEVPHVPFHGVRAGAVAARVVDVHAEEVVERVLLERADGLAEQPRADEEQEVGHDDEEDGERCMGMGGLITVKRVERKKITCSAGELVDDEPADEAAEETDNCSDGDGHGGLA